MTLSGIRQQFLSADIMDSETLRYSRRGGCFVSRGQCAILFVGAIIMAVIAAGLVYFFAPCRVQQRNEDTDDLWKTNDLSSETLTNYRLPKNILPSYYRILLTPNFNNFTFTGNVLITISTPDQNVKKIILHSKDLVISEGYDIKETLVAPKTNRSKRQITENLTPVTEQANTVASEIERANITNAVPVTDSTNAQTETPKTETPESTETTMITEIPRPRRPLETTVSLDHDYTPNYKVTNHNRNVILIVSKSIDTSSETLTFELNSALKANTHYVLRINFSGILDDSLIGFYRSSYKEGNTTRYLAVTQFEPTSARKAFPCFDEPQMKAVFEISIARDKNMIALSNAPANADEVINGTDMILTHFGKTVAMSTYLVAFAVSDFRSVEAQYDSSVINATEKPKIKIWSRESFLDRTGYAASIAPKILIYYEEYFDIPYALEKMDLVAVPDFSSGAMENWGLITFREISLLIDPDESTIRLRQIVATDLAHEIAHQWFGNLVTMKWWSDLWLNEGFATYISYIGVDKVEPSWNILDQFNTEKISLMKSDALDSTHALSQDVQEASEIAQKFDEISYSKGAVLIRVLNHTLTEGVFKLGIQNYLKKWKFNNADKDDLWDSLTEVASKYDILPKNITVAKLMNSWTTQKGFPVLQITRNYEKDTIILQQEIFTLPVSKEKSSPRLWYIPISYTSGAVPVENWSANATVWLTERSKEVKLAVEANNSWLYVNVFAIGYYRVNYDPENWKRLSNALHLPGSEKLPEIFKMQILDDAFNLARTGLLDYPMVLNMSTYIINRTEGYTLWLSILMNLDYLNVLLETSPAYSYFQEYVLKLIERTLSDIGDDVRDNESQETTLLREELLSWACKMEHPKYLKWARTHFERWMNQSDPLTINPIPKDSRSIIYNTVLRNGGRQEFNFLWGKLNESNDPVVRRQIISSLSSTRNVDLLNRLYEFALTDLELQLSMYAWNGENSKIGYYSVLNFVQKNWDRLIAKYNSSDPMISSSIFGGLFGTISEQYELDQMKIYIQEHKKELKNASETLKQELTAAENRIYWKKNYQNIVENWLKNFANRLSSDAAASKIGNSTNATQN